MTITAYSRAMSWIRLCSVVLILMGPLPLYAATEIATRANQEPPEDNQVVVELSDAITTESQKTDVPEPDAPEVAPLPVVLGSRDDRAASTADTPPGVVADGLREALEYVLAHHPQLLAERDKLAAVEQSIDLAMANFKPDIRADYAKGRERISINDARWNYGDTQSKGLVVTQPIFSGLDGVAGLRAARERLAAAQAELAALEQQLLYQAVVAYTGVVEADHVLALNQHNVEVLSKQRDAAQARFEVGELTKTDVSQAEARLATAKANEQQAVADAAISRSAYRRTVGNTAPPALEMPGVPPALPASLADANEHARSASPLLEAARRREAAFAQDVEAQIGAFIPDVSLQGSMRRTEGGTGFSRSYDSDQITLNVAIPLYQSGAEWARWRQASKIASQAKYLTLDTALAVDQDVAGAWQNFVTAESIIASSEAARHAAELALEGVQQEHEYGVRTVLDVLDAEQELMATKVSLMRAVRNHKIQAYRLLASIGKLTAHELSLTVGAPVAAK